MHSWQTGKSFFVLSCISNLEEEKKEEKSQQFRFFIDIYSIIKYYTAALKVLILFHVYVLADKSQSFHTVFELKSS